MGVTIKLEDSDKCENVMELEFVGLVIDWRYEMVEKEVTLRF